jgi:hypothetical protein
MVDSSNDKLLTPGDLSTRLAVGVATLANWRTQGIGPAYLKTTPGQQGRVRYWLSDVRKWEQSLNRIQPAVALNVEAAYDHL